VTFHHINGGFGWMIGPQAVVTTSHFLMTASTTVYPASGQTDRTANKPLKY
jgi:hypothetical protein